MRASARRALLLLPPLGWLALFLVVPTFVLLGRAFTLEGLARFDAPAARLLLRSSGIAAAVTLLCLLAGYPVALFLATAPPRLRKLLLFLVVLPLWSSLVVRTWAQIQILRPLGLYLTMPGVVLGLAHGYLPFMILPLYVSLEKLPARLLEAARDLGATPAQAFRSVTLPLSAPGIAAGCLIVFVPVLGSFATPEMLGGRAATMYGSQIHYAFTAGQNPAAGSALTVVLALLTLLMVALLHRVRGTGVGR